ncbi:DUF1573 domain-containing protein [Ferruginibacter lapsinanis]|uniref:DUF1573 domain-containing protein n=1 Tax=Ferruginibacter lapsinanis TaxID=563172 RepID=UPI001E3469D3|nr:DUF1573 domain-containing protein [Ferruginibacter lapsinanis]UEG50218.1 DUF1573 domain-containing protein [Ferruginibacter lapsinanis]
MKKLAVFIFSGIVMLTANAQTGLAKGDVLGLKETQFDFGRIPQGKPVTHVFEVVNNGQDSLRIVNIEASCGCTTPEWEREKVQGPGEQTAITVGFNAGVSGKFEKTITVVYNNNQKKQIIIKGDVWATPGTSAPENKEAASLKDL